MSNIKKHKYFILTTGGIFALNAFIYFFIKLFITDYNLIGSPMDNYIPFVPVFIYIYNIWYPLEIISLFYIYKKDKNTYIKTIISLTISIIIMHIIFIVYPTMVDRPIVNSFNSLTTLLLFITFKSDTPVNCFPSGHCLICFILIFAFIRSKDITLNTKIIMITLNILIILSTLLVKQHVLIDVIGSLLITVISYYLLSNLKVFDNLKKKLALFS